jgi:dTDP-4-amino-4,6-dideoxygalactose transaminase
MDPVLLEKAIEERRDQGTLHRVKAIIVVHLYGMPANMNDIISIADKYDIPVIEDAAEALGSRYKNIQVGTFGKMAVLLLTVTRLLPHPVGGALISDDVDLISRARFLSTQARDKAPHYQHSEMGITTDEQCSGVYRTWTNGSARGQDTKKEGQFLLL